VKFTLPGGTEIWQELVVIAVTPKVVVLMTVPAPLRNEAVTVSV